MKTEHKYAQVLRWIADGQKVEGRAHSANPWAAWPCDFTSGTVQSVLAGIGVFEFRIKPRTVKIGGREVEAPVLEPVEGQKLWYWDSGNGEVSAVTYGTAFTQVARDGELFASADAATAAYSAYCALLRGES